MRDSYWGIVGFLFCSAIIVSFVLCEYQMVQKYFPNITFWEYLMLNDKIRITPG